MLLQQFPVDARLVVIAFKEGARGELDQVVVADVVLGHEDEVVIHLLATLSVATGVIDTSTARRSISTGVGGHIGFDPDDRVDAASLCALVEVEDTIHVPMVGDRHSGLVVLLSLVEEVVDSGGPIEHRVLGMGVKVDKRLHLPSRLVSAVGWLRRRERILFATTQTTSLLLVLGPGEKGECT
jgi:hypothetical protein